MKQHRFTSFNYMRGKQAVCGEYKKDFLQSMVAYSEENQGES